MDYSRSFNIPMSKRVRYPPASIEVKQNAIPANRKK